MATTTVIPTVTAALKSQLTAATSSLTYEGVAPVVFDAFPAQFTGLDYVVIGDVIEGRHEYVTMKAGRKPRDESYLQRVHIITNRGGSESTDARTAAIAILNTLEDLMANDPCIGLTAIPTLRLNATEFTMNTTHEAATMGWRVTINVNVLVQARLT